VVVLSRSPGRACTLQFDKDEDMAVGNHVGGKTSPGQDALEPGQSNMEVREGKQAGVGGWRGIMSTLDERADVELRGCTPIPYEERTETNFINIFTLWFSMSCNPLP
jgi:hypothetical protein